MRATIQAIHSPTIKRGEDLDSRKELLLASAARLYSLGIDLEAARERLRQLVEQGVSYDSNEIKQAVRDFTDLKRKWKELEKQHLELRSEIMNY